MLTAPPTSGEEAVAACNALGLFSDGGRLVVVEGVESWRAPDVEAVEAYLADASPAPCSRCGRTRRRRAARSRLSSPSAGKVLSYDVPRPRSPSAWVGRASSSAWGRGRRRRSPRLVEIVGDDVLMLASEIEKIATWAAGRPIGVREIEALAVPAREVEAWAVTDAWGARDLAAALTACEASLEQREPFSIAVGAGFARGSSPRRPAPRGGRARRARGRQAPRAQERVPGPQGARPLRELLARGAR